MKLIVYKIITNLHKYNKNQEITEEYTEEDWSELNEILIEQHINTGNIPNQKILVNICKGIFGDFITDKLIENNCLNNKLIQLTSDYKVNILCSYCFNCSSCFNCHLCINSLGLYNCDYCYNCNYIYDSSYQINKTNCINIDKEIIFNNLTPEDINNADISYNPSTNTINLLNVKVHNDIVKFNES